MMIAAYIPTTEHGRILMMILVLLFSIFLGWLVKVAAHYIFKKALAKREIDPGNFVLVLFLTRLTIMVVGIGYAISIEPNVESATASMLASAGIVTAVVGFAAKDAFSNVVSGAMIIIFKPFTLGHWIKVGNITEGTVEEIKMMYTVVRDHTNRRLIIPNAKISSSDVINSSYHNEAVIEIVSFSISYESDIDKARAIIQKVGEANPYSIDKRSKEDKENNSSIIYVGVSTLGASDIVLSAYVWITKAKNGLMTKKIMNEGVRKEFNKEGIVFPFPNLVVRNHEIKPE